jgi:hypothetical protein
VLAFRTVPGSMVSMFSDITERRQVIEALRTSVRQFQQLFDNSPDAIFVESLDGIVRDVTNRKRAEIALLESETRFRHMSEAGFEGILLSDNNRIIAANTRIADMLGYRHTELLGKPFTKEHIGLTPGDHSSPPNPPTKAPASASPPPTASSNNPEATSPSPAAAANNELPRGHETILFAEDEETVRELAERMRQLDPQLKVIFSTGYTNETDWITSNLSAVTGYLPKPFTPTVLAHKVREILDA